MIVEQTPLKDCLLIKPDVFRDERGSFLETYNHERFKKETGLDVVFVQDNQSVSQKGTLRGLHFQTGEAAQAKLVRTVMGEILDVAVDLRKGSPTFGKHFKTLLSGENNHQLFVPRGFAHGFLVLSETAVFAYKCDNYYDKSSEAGIIYNDKTLAIDWDYPEEKLVLSEKDKNLPEFLLRNFDAGAGIS